MFTKNVVIDLGEADLIEEQIFNGYLNGIK